MDIRETYPPEDILKLFDETPRSISKESALKVNYL
jgi:hypothetical protein